MDLVSNTYEEIIKELEQNKIETPYFICFVKLSSTPIFDNENKEDVYSKFVAGPLKTTTKIEYVMSDLAMEVNRSELGWNMAKFGLYAVFGKSKENRVKMSIFRTYTRAQICSMFDLSDDYFLMDVSEDFVGTLFEEMALEIDRVQNEK